MRSKEMLDLLILISGLDNRIVADETVTSWMRIVGHLSFDEAAAAVDVHFSTPNHAYLMPAHLIALTSHGARNARQDLAADVRSAKARRLVPASWPERQPLEPAVAHRLAELRRDDREVVRQLEVANDLAAHRSPIDTGLLVKQVPRG